MQSPLAEKVKVKSDGFVMNIEQIKEVNKFEKINIFDKLFEDKGI